MKILITGAAGFVGHNLCRYLVPRHSLRRAVRRLSSAEGEGAAGTGQVAAVGDVCGTTDWSPVLEGMEAVVHLANRAHVTRETTEDPLAECRAVNVEGTRRLAEQAAVCGVRRLIYLSSVKVLGERTMGHSFDEASAPAPGDPYAQSKWEAEQALWTVAKQTGLQVVVLRPPLVYGPGVGANFLRLMNQVARGLPLPVASIRNRRSLIYVVNLSSAIEACLVHPAAAGRTFLVSDGEPVSTAQLVSMLAGALDVPDRSWRCPPILLRSAATLAGMGAQAARLLDSLAVDDAAIRRELEWTPPCSMRDGLRETAMAYRAAGG